MMIPNWPTKTAGGRLFWETLDLRNSWKLQQNIFTGHYRILDSNNVRQAWGTEEGEMWKAFRNFVGKIVIDLFTAL